METIEELKQRIKELTEENQILKESKNIYDAESVHSKYISYLLQGNKGKIVFLPEGTIVGVNHSLVSELGFDNQSLLLGISIFELFSPVQGEIFSYCIDSLINSSDKKEPQVALNLKKSDGGLIDTAISLTYFEDKDYDIELIVATIASQTPKIIISHATDEKKRLLEEAQKIARIGFWQFTYADRRVYWSDEVYKIFEIDSSVHVQTLEESLFYIHADDQNKMNEIFEEESAIHHTRDQELVIRAKINDGSVKYLLLKWEFEYDKAGLLMRAFGTISDISESYFRELKIKENEQLFRSLFNNLTDIFFILDVVTGRDGKVLDYVYKDVNPVFEMKFGVAKKDIIGKKISGHIPSIFFQMHPLFNVTVIANEPQQDRLYIQALDCFFDVLIYTPSDNIIATIWRDVSLMVEADRSLRESEEKYRQIFSISSDALFMVDLQTGNILDVNPMACFMYAYQREHLLEMSFQALSSDPSRLIEMMGRQVSAIINETGVKGNKQNFPVEMALSYFNWSGRKVVFVSVRDISERLASQERLIKSEQKFKQLFDYSNDAILIISNYRIIDYNKKALALFEGTIDELSNKTLWNLSPAKQASGEDSRSNAVEFLQNCALGKQFYFEWVFTRFDNTSFQANVKISPIFYGSERVVQAIIRDITPQKETERALKESEERWKFALEGSFSGVWDWNIATNEVFFSSVWKKTLGYSEDEIPDMFNQFERFIHPDDYKHFKRNLDDYVQGKQTSFSVEYRIQSKNGVYKWMLSQGKITAYIQKDKPSRFIGTQYDITKYKILEKDSKDELNKVKLATQLLQTNYWFLDLRTMILHGKEGAFLPLGISENQLLLKQVEKTIHPEDKDIFAKQFTALSRKKEQKIESFRVLVNNETKYIQANMQPVFENQNVLCGFEGVFQDITPFKQYEIESQKKQNICWAFSENLYYGIIIIQNDQVVFANKKALDITGYDEQELLDPKFKLFQLVADDSMEPFQKKVSSMLSNKTKSVIQEFELNTKHNRKKWVEFVSSPTRFNDSYAVLVTISDITVRKKAELELLIREKQFQTLAEKSYVGVAILNHANRFSYFNSSFTLFTGINSGEVINPSTEGLAPAENAKSIIGLINKQLSGQQVPDEITLLGKGDVLWRKIQIVPLVENSTIVFIEDIDKFKKTEFKLEHINQMRYQMLNTGNSAFALFSLNLNFVFANNRFDEYFGFDEKAHCYTFADTNLTSDKHLASFINSFQKGDLPSLNFEYQVNNGLILSINLSSVNINDQHYLVLCAENISTLRNDINTLQAELERYAGIYNFSSVGIAVLDKNRKVVVANKSFCSLMGAENNVLWTKKLDDFIYIEYISEVLSKYAQLYAGIIPCFCFLLKLTNVKEKQIWARINVFSIKDRFGDITNAITFVEDVSDQVEKERIAVNTEKIKMLSLLGTSISYHFNNVLMGIYGNTYLLKSKIKDEQVKEHIEQILRSTERSNELAKRFFSLSDKPRKLNVLVDLNQIINDIRKSGLLAEQKSLLVNFKPDSGNYQVIGDPVLLTVAIKNIISNSVEAMGNGGFLNIQTNDVFFEKEEFINGELELKSGKYLRIKISDSGSGIASNVLPFIFDPFYTTKNNPLNPGVGLTVALNIIKHHNGTLKFYSNGTDGTEANIYLPIPVKEELKQLVIPDEQIVRRGTANVVLVDDEEVVRTIITELLKKLGYNVFAFSEEGNAIKFIGRNYQNIHVFIADYQVVEMGGMGMLNAVARMNPNIKTIVLVGYTQDPITELDGHVYVQKPIDIDKLASIFARILN